MSRQAEIRKALAEHAGKYGPAHTMLATVDSVNADAFTCVLLDDDGLDYQDVRLRPVLDGNEALTIFPKQGTWALATRIEEGEDWMIIAVGESDKWRVKTGSSSYQVTEDGHEIKKGDDSMWDAVKLLFEALEKAVILQGKNIDRVKLTQAKTMFKNILNGA